MAPSFLSVAKFVEAISRRRFSSAGLSLQTLSIDSETTIQYWGPPPSPSPENKQKPSLLLLHGFGPSAVWQWNKQVKQLSVFFRLYIPNLVFFGSSTTTSSCSDENRSEMFQASSMAKLMDKLCVERYSVVGTSYGGFVAYNMAKMLPEKVEKVVLASSGVNLRRSDNEALITRAKCRGIEEVLLPSSATDFRRSSGMVSSRKLDYVPDFVLNDFCQGITLLSSSSKERDDGSQYHIAAAEEQIVSEKIRRKLEQVNASAQSQLSPIQESGPYQFHPSVNFEGVFVKGDESLFWMGNNSAKLGNGGTPHCWTFFLVLQHMGNRTKFLRFLCCKGIQIWKDLCGEA